ncbi:MAG TPA: hypothetical protein VMD99_03205 [Terriglobales bacterium]|nr:hypothetical protein [Terriglobales bacterium]
MKKRISIATLFLAAIALLTTSCGTSDYLKSLTLSATGGNSGGFYNLSGVDGTLQLQVTANYNSGKTINVTNAVTWNVSPVGCATTADNATYLCPNEPGAQSPYSIPAYSPTTVPISPTGLMTGIVPMCTWTDAVVTTNGTTAPASPPDWEYTGYYQVTATYRNFTSQPVGVGVAVTASDDFAGCGPS